jgi:hypothetical protein
MATTSLQPSLDYTTFSSFNNNNIGNDNDMKNLLNALPRGHDWSLPNYTTILNWLNVANLNNLLLDFTIVYYRSIINKVTIVTLIVSSIASTIALLQFSNDKSSNIYLAIQIFNVILSFVTSILAGYLKITRMSDILDEAHTLHQQVTQFIIELSLQLQLPINIRTNALKLIMLHQTGSKTLLASDIEIPSKVKQLVAQMLRRDDDRARLYHRLLQDENFGDKVVGTAPTTASSASLATASLQRQTSLFDDQMLSSMNQTQSTSTDPNTIRPEYRERQEGGSVFLGGDTSKMKPLNTKKAKQKYIYDSDRLHFYFIIKDIILNELSNITQTLRSTKMISEHEVIIYSVLPGRIYLKRKHISYPSPPILPKEQQHPINDRTIQFVDNLNLMQAVQSDQNNTRNMRSVQSQDEIEIML